MSWQEFLNGLCYDFGFVFLYFSYTKRDCSPKNYPLVVPNPWDLRSSSEHKLRYFWWNPRAFWPCIDSKGTTTFKAKKRSKDIVKIVQVISVVKLSFYENTIILVVSKKTKVTKYRNSGMVLHFKCFETFPPSHAAGKGMVTLCKIILSEHASVMNCTLTVN